MSVENYFLTKSRVNPLTQIESDTIVFLSPATITHFDSNTTLLINDSVQPLGSYSVVANDTLTLSVLSSADYSKQVYGLVRIQEGTDPERLHTFAVITRPDIQPIHIEDFSGKIPYEMNTHVDGTGVSDNVFAYRNYKNKITSFDKSVSIEYPDEQFKLDYPIGENQFNSDTSYVTCSFYTDRVLRHSRRTKRLIASIPVSGHPCEFVEVPRIPGVDNITDLVVTLSNVNKIAFINSGNSVSLELPTGAFPTGIVYNGISIYVANSNDNTVGKYDWNGSTWILSNTISVGVKPYQLATDQNGDIWVSCANDSNIYKIVGVIPQSISIGDNPRGIVCLESSVFVALSKTDQVVKLDLSGNILDTFDDTGIHPYVISRPIEIDPPADPAYVQDDWYSSNALLINSDDSFFGGNNVDIQDSSGAALSIYGAPQHTQFSPYQDGWGAKFNGGSLSIQDTPSMYIGTSDFTIEFWINFASINQQGIFHTSGNNLSGSMWCGFRYDGLMVAISGMEGYQSFGFWFTPQIGRWAHVAISRGAGATRIFINGDLRSVTTKLNGVDIKQNGWIIGNNSDTSLPFGGTIADFHVTKTCKYVGSSIVNSDVISLDPFSTLATLQGKNFSDISSYNHQISVNSDVKMIHFSPYSLGFDRSDNYSGFFDGTNDYIKTTFEENLGKGDFTFEAWVYRNTASNGKLIELGNLIIRENGAVDSVVGALVGMNHGGWYHLAIVKRDGTFYRYLNGALADSLTNDYHTTGRSCFVCRTFSGYVMNLRFPYSAVYTTSFSVPAKVLVLPETKLLLKFRNAGVVDVTGKNLIKTTNYPFTHSEAKFGDYGLVFNEEVIRIPHQQFWSLWNRDCTIEFWMNTTDSGCTIMSKSNSTFTQNSWRIGVVGGKLKFDHSGLGNEWLLSPQIVSDGQWHHVAISKLARTEKLFIDGTRADYKTYCLSTFIDFPNTVHEQTSTPIVLRGNMESGDVLNLNAYTLYEIISGSSFASIIGGNVIVNDIVPDASITIRATTTYRGEVFVATKAVALTHNPELVSIEIVGSSSIIEQDSAQYSIIAHMSDGSSYAPNNNLVTWELESLYANVNSTGLVSTENITGSSKIVILNATYTDNGVEPETKSTSKSLTVVYYPELISTTISVPASASLTEGAILQMLVSGNLEDGSSGVLLPSSVWSVLNGSSHASITPGGILTINPSTAGESVTLRCVSEYTAGLVFNSVTTDYTFNILPEFSSVELLICGDVLATTVTANLVSIQIVGVSSLPEDQTHRFTAMGTFDNGVVKDVSAFTNWSLIAGPSHATIDAGGLLIPNNIIGDKLVTINASTTIAGINKTDTHDVSIVYIPILDSIAINSSSFNELSNGILSITGYWDDGTSWDAAPYTVWELVSGSAATVSPSGDITTFEVPFGGAVIRVKATTTRGTVTLIAEKDISVIDLPKLVSLTLIKGSGVTSPGSSIQFTSSGTLEDSSVINASPYTTWEIQSGVGSISPSGLLNIPLNSVGEIIVVKGTATYNNGTAFDTYTVTVIDDFINVELLICGDVLSTTIIPQLTDITINGASLVTEQTTSQYTVTGHFNNGGLDKDLTYKTSWSIVSGGAYASINSSGLLTANNITGGDQSVTIRATTTYRGITIIEDKVITIDIVPVFNGVTINGANSVIEQQSTQYTATGNMDDGSSFDATPYVTWSIISGSEYGSINSSGLLTANNITASNKTIVIRASVTYNSTTIVQDKTISVIWEPIFESAEIFGNASIYEFGYTQLTITGYYDGGTSFDASPYTTWEIQSGGATINSSGFLVSSGGVGTVIAKATTTHLGNTVISYYNVAVSNNFPIVELMICGDILSTTIIPTIIDSTINGANTLIEGNSTQYTVTGHFNNGGSDIDVSNKTSWSIVSGGAYASINSSGLLTANNISPPDKSVTIRATTTYRGVTVIKDKIVTIQYVQTFDSVIINGANSVDELTDSTYTATGVMDDGATFDATPYVTWSIFSGGAYGSINSGGVFSASNVTADQSVTIRATVTYNSITKIQDKIITVVFIPLFDHVIITGDTVVDSGEVVQYTATGYLEDGTPFDAMPYSTWSILSGSSFASVDTNGLVTFGSPVDDEDVIIEVSTTYEGITKTDSHLVTITGSSGSDPQWNNVALLINGENVTPYSDFMLNVALLINGENVTNYTDFTLNVALLLNGEAP